MIVWYFVIKNKVPRGFGAHSLSRFVFGKPRQGGALGFYDNGSFALLWMTNYGGIYEVDCHVGEEPSSQ